ncbi:MAG: hypothetical protein J6Y59_00440 [Bacteroidaceae bacterium]|nr:hypothetical protein [Bacteroidaceae bacterium]
MRRLKKKIFLSVFGGTVLLLGAVRLAFPEVTAGEKTDETQPVKEPVLPRENSSTTTGKLQYHHGSTGEVLSEVKLSNLPIDSEGRVKWHPVRSVPSYAACFPDVQEVQIVAAQKWGVSPVRNRQEAEHRRKELVYVGANPFYCIDKGMTHSIPYLVPRAAHLLSTIGRNYLDSLYIKGIPLHQIIVSSVLRTEDDVARLQQRNGNASDQSCHRFGTTFDICYNRYSTVSPPGEPARRTVQNDTLKWVLSEVLRDIREKDLCYIKYEVKQGCFHITVR